MSKNREIEWVQINQNLSPEQFKQYILNESAYVEPEEVRNYIQGYHEPNFDLFTIITEDLKDVLVSTDFEGKEYRYGIGALARNEELNEKNMLILSDYPDDYVKGQLLCNNYLPFYIYEKMVKDYNNSERVPCQESNNRVTDDYYSCLMKKSVEYAMYAEQSTEDKNCDYRGRHFAKLTESEFSELYGMDVDHDTVSMKLYRNMNAPAYIRICAAFSLARLEDPVDDAGINTAQMFKTIFQGVAFVEDFDIYHKQLGEQVCKHLFKEIDPELKNAFLRFLYNEDVKQSDIETINNRLESSLSVPL